MNPQQYHALVALCETVALGLEDLIREWDADLARDLIETVRGIHDLFPEARVDAAFARLEAAEDNALRVRRVMEAIEKEVLGHDEK